MIVRDPFTTLTSPQVGPSTMLGQVPASGTAAGLWQQVRGLTVSIRQAIERADAAARAGHRALAERELGTVEALRGYLASMSARWQAAAEAEDPTALTALDRVVLATGDYVADVGGTVASGARLVATAPRRLVVGVLDEFDAVLRHLLARVGGLVVPVLALGAGAVALLLYGVRHAERTRTYRRFVA